MTSFITREKRKYTPKVAWLSHPEASPSNEMGHFPKYVLHAVSCF